MKNSTLKRVVHGDPTDPTSTREITGLSLPEIRAIDYSLDWAIFESNALLNLSDQQLAIVASQKRIACKKFGIPEFEPVDDFDRLRADLIIHREVLTKLRDRLFPCFFAGKTNITRITPKEFEHLIIALQHACGEAMIYSQISAQKARLALAEIQKVAQKLNLKPFTRLDEHREDLPTFFARRLVLLERMLQVINQPYPTT
ncbi:MAG: hypothetical protein AAGN35_20555 [Bacteroidota bacterium]